MFGIPWSFFDLLVRQAMQEGVVVIQPVGDECMHRGLYRRVCSETTSDVVQYLRVMPRTLHYRVHLLAYKGIKHNTKVRHNF